MNVLYIMKLLPRHLGTQLSLKKVIHLYLNFKYDLDSKSKKVKLEYSYDLSYFWGPIALLMHYHCPSSFV
jgi:hypothetical protein